MDHLVFRFIGGKHTFALSESIERCLTTLRHFNGGISADPWKLTMSLNDFGEEEKMVSLIFTDQQKVLEGAKWGPIIILANQDTSFFM